MILRIAYIIFFLVSGLIFLDVHVGKLPIIAAGISAILIAVYHLLGAGPVSTGPRRWLW